MGLQGPAGEAGQGPAGEAGIFDINHLYDTLKTEDKSVIGAINEIFNILTKLLPNIPEGAPMYYGYIPYEISGVVDHYNQITKDMIIKSGESMKTVAPDRIGKVSVGLVPEGALVVIAVPTVYKFNITKDNGFGGKVPFNTDVAGSNGTDVVFEGIPYKVYGEMLLTDGELFIHID